MEKDLESHTALFLNVLSAAVLTDRDDNFDLNDAPLYTWKLAGTTNPHLPGAFGTLFCVYTFKQAKDSNLKMQFGCTYGGAIQAFLRSTAASTGQWSSWYKVELTAI